MTRPPPGAARHAARVLLAYARAGVLGTDPEVLAAAWDLCAFADAEAIVGDSIDDEAPVTASLFARVLGVLVLVHGERLLTPGAANSLRRQAAFLEDIYLRQEPEEAPRQTPRAA